MRRILMHCRVILSQMQRGATGMAGKASESRCQEPATWIQSHCDPSQLTDPEGRAFYEAG